LTNVDLLLVGRLSTESDATIEQSPHNSQKERQMNSKAETNAAMPANQDNAAQETSVKGEYASVGDLKMYYEIHGTGRPLVLLHGAFMSATV
jgi:hypothetical protein